MGSVPNIEIVGHTPSKHLAKAHTLLLASQQHRCVLPASLVTRVSQCCQRLIPQEAPAMSACSWHEPQALACSSFLSFPLGGFLLSPHGSFLFPVFAECPHVYMQKLNT